MFFKKREKPQNIYTENPLENISENYTVISALKKNPDIFRRSLIYIILSFIITSFIYMNICKVDIMVKSHSVVTPTTYSIKVYSDQDGYVEKVLVKYGEEVEENSPLFLIRSKETLKYHAKARELLETIPMKEEDYRGKIQSIKEKLVHIETDFNRATQVKKIKLEQNKLTLFSLQADKVFLNNEVQIMEKEYEDNNVLFTKGLISANQLNKIKSNHDKNKTELQKIISRLEINEKDAIIIEEEIEKIKENFLSEKTVLLDEIKKLKMERETSVKVLKNELEMYKRILSIQTGETNPADDEMDKEITIKSKKAGTISELFVRNSGDYVKASQLLCTILPKNSPLKMEITVANKDIGFIQEGMEIKYKFDAFPFMDYGMRYGKVLSISPSAIENDEMGFAYSLYGSLDQTNFKIMDKAYPIKVGMLATAEIVTEKKNLFTFLFRKFH